MCMRQDSDHQPAWRRTSGGPQNPSGYTDEILGAAILGPASDEAVHAILATRVPC